MTRLAGVVVCALALLGAGCGGGTQTSTRSREATRNPVTELKDIAQLRAAFNAHAGVPRLIVLASPT